MTHFNIYQNLQADLQRLKQDLEKRSDEVEQLADIAVAMLKEANDSPFLFPKTVDAIEKVSYSVFAFERCMLNFLKTVVKYSEYQLDDLPWEALDKLFSGIETSPERDQQKKPFGQMYRPYLKKIKELGHRAQNVSVGAAKTFSNLVKVCRLSKQVFLLDDPLHSKKGVCIKGYKLDKGWSNTIPNIDELRERATKYGSIFKRLYILCDNLPIFLKDQLNEVLEPIEKLHEIKVEKIQIPKDEAISTKKVLSYSWPAKPVK